MNVPNLTKSILNPTLSVISYFSNGQTIEGNKDLVERCEETLDEVCTLSRKVHEIYVSEKFLNRLKNC